MLIDLNYPIRIAWPKENAIMISEAKKNENKQTIPFKSNLLDGDHRIRSGRGVMVFVPICQ